jgi:hypothetical protein
MKLNKTGVITMTRFFKLKFSRKDQFDLERLILRFKVDNAPYGELDVFDLGDLLTDRGYLARTDLNYCVGMREISERDFKTRGITIV